MKTNIFLPKKINVGFQERKDTYTGKLAYVIYFDAKGVLRKESSWNSWRDQKIQNEEFENEPTSGFVLNKKAGGYSTGWNHRQTYVRIYDPRGFEFEITVPNLLYILENTNSIKGKGLEGDFVYGWDGKDLVLIPVDSPDYEEITKLNDLRHEQNYVKGRDLKVGCTYLDVDGKELIFMGKFHEYTWKGKSKNKSFFFYNSNSEYRGFITMKSVSEKLVSTVSEECVENYADIMDELEGNTSYSPVDSSKETFTHYTYDEIVEKMNNCSWSYIYCYNNERQRVEICKITDGNYYSRYYNDYRSKIVSGTLKEVFDYIQPMWRTQYLENGRLYKEEK